MRERSTITWRNGHFYRDTKVAEVFELVKQYGGTPVSLPLIQVEELDGTDR